MNAAPTQVGSTVGRLHSLDAYRGFIMLCLLCGGIFHSLKGNPGWNWLYVQTEHVEWEGCVFWDLIQPSFMFMVGVAMPFAFAKRSSLGDTWAHQFRHAILRALLLTLIGIMLDHFGSNQIQIGFIRVLQQIAIGYLLTFFLLRTSVRVQALAAVIVLVGYQCLWMFNGWNGPGGAWAKGNENIGSAFDFWLLGRNYSHFYVGLNAIPSAVTILLGIMVGQQVRDTGAEEKKRTCRILLLWGVIGVVLGLGLSRWFPLIKRIWTPSFTVYAAGWTTLMLLAFYWIIEVRGGKRWSFPLVVVGTNSIAAYILGNAFGGWFRSLSGAWVSGLKPLLGDIGFPILQHALFAAWAWFVLWWMYRRKIFLKV